MSFPPFSLSPSLSLPLFFFLSVQYFYLVIGKIEWSVFYFIYLFFKYCLLFSFRSHCSRLCAFNPERCDGLYEFKRGLSLHKQLGGHQLFVGGLCFNFYYLPRFELEVQFHIFSMVHNFTPPTSN